MIVDSHAHTFPFLGDLSGYETVEEHMRWLQLYLIGHSQPVRYIDNDEEVVDQGLADLPLRGFESLKPVHFRVEPNGRFVWERGERAVYIHFMPPSMQTNESPGEYMLAEMAYAGIDVAVLQNAHLYGDLNQYFSDIVYKYPRKFIALAQVDEVTAHHDTEIDKLRTYVQHGRLRGLYYANRAFAKCDYAYSFDDSRFDPFWDTVAALGIPVFWELSATPLGGSNSILLEIERLVHWSEDHKDIPCVYTHGFSPDLLDGNAPEPVARLLARDQFLIEILYPISWGRGHDYPYEELRPPLLELYNRVGANRLIWGSDMPNVQRHCTYRQSLSYVTKLLKGRVSDGDIAKILGENMLGLFASPRGDEEPRAVGVVAPSEAGSRYRPADLPSEIPHPLGGTLPKNQKRSRQ